MRAKGSVFTEKSYNIFAIFASATEKIFFFSSSLFTFFGFCSKMYMANYEFAGRCAVKTTYVYHPDDGALRNAAAIMRAGGLVAFPTETVYGLGANGLNGEAARKVYAAKGRPSDNPLILHLFSPEQAENYAYTCPLFYKLALAFMPGPLTVILPKKQIVPDEVTGGLDTVAIRVPSHPIARAMLALCDFPVAAPSANLSGKPSPTCAAHVKRDLDGRIDMILDGGECAVGVESTIVKIDGEDLTLLRPGAVTPEMLSAFCTHFSIDPSLDKPLSAGERPLAPGMKYKHYAPNASVILLDGGEDAICAFMLAHRGDENVGFLCSEALKEQLDTDTALSYGSEGECRAHTLFSCLRRFDEMPRIKVIYTPLPDRSGIGLAVYNRLAKAAGFTVMKLENNA